MYLSLRSLYKVSQSSSLFLKVCLRSTQGLVQVSLGFLSVFLAYLVGPTEPKILRLVPFYLILPAEAVFFVAKLLRSTGVSGSKKTESCLLFLLEMEFRSLKRMI